MPQHGNLNIGWLWLIHPEQTKAPPEGAGPKSGRFGTELALGPTVRP